MLLLYCTTVLWKHIFIQSHDLSVDMETVSVTPGYDIVLIVLWKH